MLLRSLVLLIVLVTLLPVPMDAAEEKGGKIKKCQDATGKWHYGDRAAQECAQSKIVEMSEQGMTKKEIAAPLSEAELKRKAEILGDDERKRLDAEERKRTDQILLSTYGHEDDIKFVRDRKLAQVEASIKSSTETLKPLNKTLERLEAQAADEAKSGKASAQTAKGIETTKAQIAKHEAVVVTKRQEQQQIRKQAEADLARYLELKKAPVPDAAARKNGAR
jgi:hypothetical protein